MKTALAFPPYELVLREIEKGILDPFDIDLEHLIELFRKEAHKLKEWEYFEEAGRFLEAAAKLLKLQIEDVFPRPRPERKRITIEEVREVLAEEAEKENKYDLSFLWDYTPRVGRPSGSKDTVERKITQEEVQSVPLHREINYHELAKEVREKILRGEFRIKTITDFIAYLFAFYEYEDVPDILNDRKLS